MERRVVNPASLVKPAGYSYALQVKGGTTLFLAGQVAYDQEGQIVGQNDMVKQFDQALSNMKAVVEEGGGSLQDMVSLTMYVTDKEAYKQNLRSIGQVYRDYFGKYFPAITLVEVKSLFDDEALIEIEGIAVLDQS